MTQRLVRDARDLELLILFLGKQKLPFTVNIVKGLPRTVLQNRLGRLWLNEISEQLGDRTTEEVRADAKLRFGVPILRAENEIFCEKYDRLIKHLPYETKMELMSEPIDFPVTRLMKTGQKKRYLDSIYKFYSEQGVVLTDPEMQGR